MFARLSLLTAAMITAGASAAAAQSVTAASPETVVHALQELGYQAKLETDSDGDPKIKSTASGVNFSIYFYGCDDGARCQDVILSAGFIYDQEPQPSLEMMNSWNATKLTGAAFIDEDGDPFIEHFVAGLQDMSPDSFERLIFRWDQAIGAFIDFIDW